MEPAKIDWKRIESVFVEDKLYENINAPKWVDFLVPEQDSVDDETWFCRPDCKHPKTAEDFLKTPPTSKLPRLIERLPFGDMSQRDARFKRRGQNQSSFSSNERSKFNEDGENQNPNSPTPNNYQAKSLKAAIKSSSEKNKLIDDISQKDDQVVPRLKSTLSARNLFLGQDILGHITEFCNELKKLASRARERENVDKLDEKKSEVGVKKEAEVVSESCCEVLGELNAKEKERKPLLEVEKEKSEGIEKGSGKDKQIKKKRFDDEAENTPIPLKLENLKHKGEERVLQIRTNPPSPQCFSANRAVPKTTTPLKASVSRPMEKRIFQEMEHNREVRKDDPAEKVKSVSNIVDGREARTLDVFWFLKPCTPSS